MNRNVSIGAVLVASLACASSAAEPPKPATGASSAQPSAAGSCTQGEPDVTYKGGVFTATFCPNVEAEGPVYAGATVIKEDGTRHDLPFVTVAPEQRGTPVTIKEDVGPEYEGWSTIVWQTAEDCTDGESDGCRLYGKRLYGALWATPGWDEWGDMPFQEFKPVRVQIVDAGGGPSGVAAVRGVVGELPVVDGGKAKNARDFIEVMYRRPRFRDEADALASQLTGHVVVREWRDAPEAIVVAVGK